MKARKELRSKALEQLRKRRGGRRKNFLDKEQGGDLDHLQMIVKSFKSRNTIQINVEATEESAVNPTEEREVDTKPEEPLRIAKLRRKTEKLDEDAAAAIKRWREIMEVRAQQKLSADTEPPSPLSMVTAADRQKMLGDLLSVDFLENTQHWLSNAKDDLDSSCTPIEEVEDLYRQAQYRQKVIRILLEQNQRTLDGMELYLRNAKMKKSGDLNQSDS